MKYTTPEMNVVKFDATEIIVASAAATTTTTSEEIGGGDEI